MSLRDSQIVQQSVAKTVRRTGAEFVDVWGCVDDLERIFDVTERDIAEALDNLCVSRFAMFEKV